MVIISHMPLKLREKTFKGRIYKILFIIFVLLNQNSQKYQEKRSKSLKIPT
uniref:Uncharacterized protein n=1 Tax=Ciona intestinalis TaxID=7719 RepID=F7BK67_CIOIN